MEIVRPLAFATLIALSASACARTAQPAPDLAPVPAPMLEEQASGVAVLLQAVSAVDDTIVWVSGHGGTYLRTTDAGRTWRAATVPNADTLQFRDVEAISAETAYLLSAGPGEMSRIYKTVDGGRTWTLQYTADHPDAFFDCLAFWDERRGIAFSDAVDGEFIVLRTETGGESWERVPPAAVPDAPAGAGGFAASGTCVVAQPGGHGWIGTGNSAPARVLHTTDYGRTWTAHDVPLVAGEGAGITSLAFRDRMHGVALGGDLAVRDDWTDNVAATRDGGRTWTLVGRPRLPGAIYGGAYVPGLEAPVIVAAGPTGLQYSADNGLTWAVLDERSFWAVGFAPGGAGWAVGPDGRIVRLGFGP